METAHLYTAVLALIGDQDGLTQLTQAVGLAVSWGMSVVLSLIPLSSRIARTSVYGGQLP